LGVCVPVKAFSLQPMLFLQTSKMDCGYNFILAGKAGEPI